MTRQTTSDAIWKNLLSLIRGNVIRSIMEAESEADIERRLTTVRKVIATAERQWKPRARARLRDLLALERKIKRATFTETQAYWLRFARARGHESPFMHKPIPSLIALAELQLIERDPSTSGRNTLWRITERGQGLSARQVGERLPRDSVHAALGITRRHAARTRARWGGGS